MTKTGIFDIFSTKKKKKKTQKYYVVKNWNFCAINTQEHMRTS